MNRLILPLNIIKKRITSAFGLIGGQTSAGPGNEGVDIATWIQAAIDDGTIDTGTAGSGNLSLGTITATAIPIAIDTGTDVTLPVATTSLAGLQSAADKTKLDGLSNYTDEMAQDAVGAMSTDGSIVYVDGTPLLTRAALTGDVTATQGSNATTIANNAVTNAKAADMAANTVKVNNTASPADPVDMAVAANTLVGRGSTGNITGITLGTNLSFAGGVLNATGGSGAGISEVEVDSTLIRYTILTGTPVFTANIASGVQTIAATGGTFKLVSVTTIGATANLAGDNSFSIIYNGVPGTTLLAYPDVTKWNLSGSAPSSGVPDLQDVDSNPQIQLIGGVAGTSVTIKVINMNTFTNWVIKSNW